MQLGLVTSCLKSLFRKVQSRNCVAFVSSTASLQVTAVVVDFDLHSQS